MATNVPASTTLRVENSFKQLATAAQALNHAADDLGKVVRHLDGSLKKLGLGIAVWVQIEGTSDDTQYWGSELGYVKMDGKWCIALREVSGYLQDNIDESEDTWAFSDAPRALRAQAVDKIPDLLEKLLQQTEEATRTMNAKTEQAAELTFLVTKLVPTPPVPAPQAWHRPSDSGDGKGSEDKGNEGKGTSGLYAMAGRFRDGQALPGQRSAPPAPESPAAPAAAAAPAPGGNSRNGEATPVDRPAAATGRVLPAERVS